MVLARAPATFGGYVVDAAARTNMIAVADTGCRKEQTDNLQRDKRKNPGLAADGHEHWPSQRRWPRREDCTATISNCGRYINSSRSDGEALAASRLKDPKRA